MSATEPLKRVRAWTESDNPLLDRREFVFGALRPGEKRSWKVPVKLPRASAEDSAARTDQRADPEEQEALVDADLDTLATALYVRTDDLLKASPERAPWRPTIGIAPKITDAELITLAVMAGSPARPAGCAMPEHTWDTCSDTCPSSPATTSGCAPWRPRS